MSELVQYKYETHTIETEVFSKKDIETHEEEVEKYKDDGWREVHTTIGYEGSMAIKRTLLERPVSLSQRGLRTECNPIDDACDIKDKIRELIHRYKYNVSTSTVSLYEEFIEDLEELIK